MTAALNLVGASPNKIKKFGKSKGWGVCAWGWLLKTGPALSWRKIPPGPTFSAWVCVSPPGAGVQHGIANTVSYSAADETVRLDQIAEDMKLAREAGDFKALAAFHRIVSEIKTGSMELALNLAY